MKGSEIDNPGYLIGLKPRRFPNWGARQQPIKICPLCSLKQVSTLMMLITVTSTNVENLIQKARMELSTASTWMQANKVNANPEKTG